MAGTKFSRKKKTFLHHKRKDRLCCLQQFKYPSMPPSARGNTRLSKQLLESNLSPKVGWCCFDLVISDRFALIWTALLRYSLRHLTSWFIVSSVSQFYLTPASGGAGIASACCHGCKTNLCGMKKDLPWSPAQQAAYLCTVWTTCWNLTTGEWKHAILRDLLTDQEQEGRGKKNWCTWKLRGRLLDSVPPTQPLFLPFFPQQLHSYLFGCEMTWKAAVRFASGWDIKTSRHILKKKRERCNEPLLRDELRFEVLLIINSFSACFCWFVLLIMLKDSFST